MLERIGAHISISIHVHNGVFVKISGFRKVAVAKLDVHRVGVLEILNFLACILDQKKALWTVSREKIKEKNQSAASLSPVGE